jgi:hypothetical protein
MTHGVEKCGEDVWISNTQNHSCKFKVSCIVKRKDGDSKRVCRTHGNQLVREGWKMK